MFAFLTHHIVSDAWSIALFVKDLSILYNAFVRNQNCPLEDLPFLYCDFANWQQSELRGTKLGRKIDFWIEKLAGSLRSKSSFTDIRNRTIFLSEPPSQIGPVRNSKL